jgi:uncharacterized protein (TIGR03437 family)
MARNAAAANTAVITGTFQGQTARFTLTLQSGSEATSLTCSPLHLTAGEAAECQVRLEAPSPDDVELPVVSMNPHLAVPEVVQLRRGQAQASFKVVAADDAPLSRAAVRIGDEETRIQDEFRLQPASGPRLSVPADLVAVASEAIRFRVAASDSRSLVVRIRADLPAGAKFDPATGDFEWTPAQSSAGKHRLTFHATNELQQTTSRTINVQVVSQALRIEDVLNAASRVSSPACSAGSLMVLRGAGLDRDTVELLANGQTVKIVAARPGEVFFQCPAAGIGATLALQARKSTTASNSIGMTLVETAPGLFSLDGSGSGQAWAVRAGTDKLVMTRWPHVPSQPAVRGDRIIAFATGLGTITPAPQLRVGGTLVIPESIEPAAGKPGVWAIRFVLPAAVESGEAVPLQLSGYSQDGKRTASNIVTLAVEDGMPSPSNP